jgi:hypothetical protein
MKCLTQQYFAFKVNIGFLSRIVGNFTYNDPSVKPLDDTLRKIITRSVVGILIFGLLVSMCIVFVMCRKRRLMNKEKAGLLYKMDKIEAKFRTQCREGGYLLLITYNNDCFNMVNVCNGFTQLLI